MIETIHSYLYPITTPSGNHYLGICSYDGNKILSCKSKEDMSYRIETLFESEHYKHGNNEDIKKELTHLAKLTEEGLKPKPITVKSKV